MKIKQEIPIFFSTDDNYIPCLAVAIYSLIKNTSKENNYRIIVLQTGISEENERKIKEFETNNVKISFEDVSSRVTKIKKDLALRLRDYYSSTIYYRLFIPSLFPEYEKAIYLDSDIIVLDDIANMFNIDLKDNYVAAIPDGAVSVNPDFQKYVKQAVGVEYKKYFNSGVLLMNLREFRKSRFEEKFLYMLTRYNLDTVAPDQDYLNMLCNGKVHYLDETWDKMPDFGKRYDEKDLHIIHYNFFRKPWHYSDVPYSDAFWRYAKDTKYYYVLQEELANYTDEQRKTDTEKASSLNGRTGEICKQELKLIDILDEANEVVENKDNDSGLCELYNQFI